MFAVGEDTDRGNRSGLWVTLRMASLVLGGWPLMSHWGKSDQHRKGARDAAARTFVDLVARGVFRSA